MSVNNYSLRGLPCNIRLIGQSNTGGCYINTIPTTRIFKDKINNAFINNITYTELGEWETLELGVNNVGWPPSYWTDVNGPDVRTGLIGIEMPLMHFVTEYYQRPAYMYKYGWGGSALGVPGAGGRDWLPSSNNIYQQSNANLTYFKNKLKWVNPYPHVDIWIQGEGNASDPGTYPARLTELILANRAFYGKSVPFIIVSLSLNQDSIASNVPAFKIAQKSIAQYVHNLDGTIMIQTGGAIIPDVHYLDQDEHCNNENGNIIHYNYEGLVNIATKILQVTKDYRFFG